MKCKKIIVKAFELICLTVASLSACAVDSVNYKPFLILVILSTSCLMGLAFVRQIEGGDEID